VIVCPTAAPGPPRRPHAARATCLQRFLRLVTEVQRTLETRYAAAERAVVTRTEELASLRSGIAGADQAVTAAEQARPGGLPGL